MVRIPLICLSACLLAAAGCAAETYSPTSPADEGGDDGSSDPGEGGDDGDDDQDDPQDSEEEEEELEEEEEEEEPAFEPFTGDWVVTESELTQDGCGLSEYVDRGEPGSVMGLEVTDPGLFELTWSAGGEVMHCAVDDAQLYGCDTTHDTSDIASEYGLSADILVQMDVDGEFFDTDAMTQRSLITLDCDGDDCGLVSLFMGASFPCEMMMESTFDAQTD